MVLPGLAVQGVDLAGRGAPGREDAPLGDVTVGDDGEAGAHLGFDECPCLAQVLGPSLGDLLEPGGGDVVDLRAALAMLGSHLRTPEAQGQEWQYEQQAPGRAHT